MKVVDQPYSFLPPPPNQQPPTTHPTRCIRHESLPSPLQSRLKNQHGRGRLQLEAFTIFYTTTGLMCQITTEFYKRYSAYEIQTLPSAIVILTTCGCSVALFLRFSHCPCPSGVCCWPGSMVKPVSVLKPRLGDSRVIMQISRSRRRSLSLTVPEPRSDSRLLALLRAFGVLFSPPDGDRQVDVGRDVCGDSRLSDDDLTP